MKRYNIMIGPSLTGAGGISSVVKQYQKSGFFPELNIFFWSSWQAGSAASKVISALKLVLKLLGWLLVGKVGLLHVHSATNISFLRKSIFSFLAIIFGVPVIFHIHSGRFFQDYQARSALYKKWVEFILKRSAAVVVLSKTWRDEAAIILKNPNSIYVLPNPIDLSLPADFKRSARQHDKLRLLFFGGLTEKKGFFDLINALSVLKKKGLNIELRCGGNGDFGRINAVLDQHQLSHSVTLLGWVDAVQKIQEFETADALVLPSHFEGQPMSILEAMQAEVLVLSTMVGGIPDIIQHGRSGLLVKPGDVAGLARQIENIYTASFVEEEMLRTAKAFVSTEHSPEAVLRKIGYLYKRLQKERNI